jgi:hypothetical protein
MALFQKKTPMRDRSGAGRANIAGRATQALRIAPAACRGYRRSRLPGCTRGEIEPNDYRSDKSVAASSSAMACGALSTLIVVIPMSRAGFKLTPRSSR